VSASNRLLRSYVRERLVEACKLPKSAYANIDSAIMQSSFWLEPNTDEDADYSKVPHVGEFNQTPAAEKLQISLQRAADSAGLGILFAVQSTDPYDNPESLITSDHPVFPDGIVVGGYATLTPNNRQAIVINMGVYEPSADISSFNPARATRKISGIMRHELVHFKQCDMRASKQKTSRSKAFKEFQDDPKAIPDRNAKKYWEVYEVTAELDEFDKPVINREGFKQSLYHQDYISSYIEVDAHAYQAADELMSLMGEKEALSLLRTGKWTSLGLDLPSPVEEYLVNNVDARLANKFRKKVVSYINDMSDKGLFKESTIPKITLTVNDIDFGVEIADCDASRKRGLMGRLTLEENTGMLFVFKDSRRRSFWMKETYLPLSIAYLDNVGRILNIESMAPLSMQSIKSFGPAKYAVEMADGWFDKRNIKPGQIMKFKRG
jgi:uncharacterized membrane protein (UPF0127 family)